MNSLLDDSSAIPEELREIAENCHSMLQDALIAFDTGSVELANQLVERDRQIDLLHDSSSQKIIRKLARESTAYFETETHMLTSLRLLERTGDAIVSIAQEVNFIHSGQR
jgi:phosphate transport system protein